MGKRYYCDYCERSFADGAENRKKHLVSLYHQKFRKAHYDMFKDAATILEEYKLKKPCRKFMNDGNCDFGTNCKYSHLTPSDIQMLEEQARIDKEGFTPVIKPNMQTELDSWVKSKLSKIKEPVSGFNTSSSVVPSMLSTIPNLPPSLIPSTVLEFYDAQKKNYQEWG